MVSDKVDYEFVIQFSGSDMPGLLHAVTGPLEKCNYNVSGISLATGGPVHSTFLTCKLAPNSGNKSRGYNRWRDRSELYSEVRKSIEECQQKYYEEEDIVAPRETPLIKIEILDQQVRTASFRVFIEMEIDDKPGCLVHLASLLKQTFIIVDTFDRPSKDGQRRVFMCTQYFRKKNVQPSEGLGDSASKLHEFLEDKLGEGDRKEQDDRRELGNQVIEKLVKLILNDSTMGNFNFNFSCINIEDNDRNPVADCQKFSEKKK